MTDPSTATTATLVGTSLGALVLAITGVEAQQLFWALVGATLGVTLAPEASRWRAAAVFVAVIFASGLLGSWAAQQLAWDGHARNGLSFVVAMLFHPLMTASIAQVPVFIAAATARVSVFFGGPKT